MSEVRVGSICHEYGCLLVKEDNNKYYWSIESCTFDKWEEIPESLYKELVKFNKEEE